MILKARYVNSECFFVQLFLKADNKSVRNVCSVASVNCNDDYDDHDDDDYDDYDDYDFE